MVLREPQSHDQAPRTEGQDPPAQDDSVREETPRAPSPFIDGTYIQWAWDSTSLGAFKRCPRYYQYKIIEGWQRQGEAIHLRWGLEFHSALEDYEHSRTAGVKHDDAVHDTIRALLQRIEDWDPQPKTKSEELKTKAHLVRSIVWYLDHFEADAAKTVQLANGRPAVEVSFSFELDYGPHRNHTWKPSGISKDNFIYEWECSRCGEVRHERERDPDNPGTCGPRYILCGHLDKIVEFSGDRYVIDHKTTTTTPGSNYFERYDVDNQMSLYTLAGQIILNSPVKGVIVDAIQVAVGFSRFVRGFTYRTPDQLEEWLEHTKRWLASAERCATEQFWPMNDTSCDKFGGCEFRGVCSRSPQVRQRWLEAEFRKEEPWNPLKPR